MEWRSGYCIIPNPTYGCDTNDVFVDTANSYNLDQFVYSPTRQNHTLDLVFASKPTLIKEVTTAPGMSDHEVGIFHVAVSIIYTKCCILFW